MNNKQTERAVLLFAEKYGKNPKDLGLKMDFYKEKHMFLYADTQEVIDAFKACQNALTDLMKYFLGSLVLCLIFVAFVLINVSASLPTVVYALLGTVGIWGAILVGIFVFCLNQRQKMKGHPFFFTYENDKED